VSATFATKTAMLECHQSQKDWLLRQHGMTDFTAAMAAQTRRRGREFGVDYAEAYRQYRGTPYPRDPALQTLLGDDLRRRASAGAPPAP